MTGVIRSLLACPEGLEPPTCCLEGSCSIQLSYGQVINRAWILNSSLYVAIFRISITLRHLTLSGPLRACAVTANPEFPYRHCEPRGGEAVFIQIAAALRASQ